VLGIPILLQYLDTGLVPRFPTASLCSALVVISVLSAATGLVLDLVAHVRREARRLTYLQHPAPGVRRGPSEPRGGDDR
jgi:hypothetical protein